MSLQSAEITTENVGLEQLLAAIRQLDEPSRVHPHPVGNSDEAAGCQRNQ